MDTEWTELKITVSPKDIDTAGDIASMTVPYGIYIEDYSNLEQETMEIAHIDLIDEDLLNKDRSKAIIHIYIGPDDNPSEALSFLSERFKACGIKYSVETQNCRQEDWINNWKKYFHPIKIGQKLLISPSWEKVSDPEGRAVLNLEPGIAFGTGTHETTRLCLQLLEKNIREGCNVLDVGCGSGILSIASLLLGASHAVGVDIDPLSVKTARENAERNGVADRFDCICGDLTDKVKGRYSVVVANIVADIIIPLSSDIINFLTPESIYIISGIIDTRENDVLKAVGSRFEIIERKEEKNWLAFSMKLR
jgi:ribosomal protein L11 methyltransferase